MGGENKYTPTDKDRELAKELAGVGLPAAMICKIIGVGREALFRELGEEMKRGEAEATATVAKTLWLKAVAGDTASLIFWLKCRANWAERSTRDTGPVDGDPEAEDVSTVELERRVAAARRDRAAAAKKGSAEPDSVH